MTEIACLALDLEPFGMVVDPVVELRLIHPPPLSLQRKPAMLVTILVAVMELALDWQLRIRVDESAVGCYQAGLSGRILDRLLCRLSQSGPFQLERLFERQLVVVEL